MSHRRDSDRIYQDPKTILAPSPRPWLAGPLMWLAGMVPVRRIPAGAGRRYFFRNSKPRIRPRTSDLGRAPDAARENSGPRWPNSLGEKDLNNVSCQQTQPRGHLLGRGRHAAATVTVVAAGHRAAIVENDRGGDFTGSNRQLFSPLYDVDGLLTYSQIGWLQQSAGALGNFALGSAGSSATGCWGITRRSTAISPGSASSVGAEARGDYLRFSTNYYYPLSALPGNGVFSAARRAVTTSRRKAIAVLPPDRRFAQL